MKKFFIWFVVIIVVVVAGAFAWDSFNLSLRQKRAKQLAEEFKKIEQEDYERAMADTYGGKTPQETLQLYIDAVEKGDYELASKYFVESKRGEELSRLEKISEVNPNRLTFLVDILKRAEPWRSSLEDNTFTMESKVESGPSFYVRFIRYPNDIWKLLEI